MATNLSQPDQNLKDLHVLGLNDPPLVDLVKLLLVDLVHGVVELPLILHKPHILDLRGLGWQPDDEVTVLQPALFGSPKQHVLQDGPENWEDRRVLLVVRLVDIVVPPGVV